MLGTFDKMICLSKVPLFAGLSLEDLAILSRIAKEQRVPGGKVIFQEGDKGDALYIVIFGNVRVFKGSRDTQVTVAKLGVGELVGEMAILDESPRSASVEAIEDSVLLAITKEDFKQLIVDHVQIAFKLFEVFSRRIRDLLTAKKETKQVKAS